MTVTTTKAPSRPRTARGVPDAQPQRRPRRRAARRQPAPSAAPSRCVVLAVDTATRSGWAALTHGSDAYLGFGEADTLDRAALSDIVRWAAAHARCQRVPVVLVLESPFGGPVATLLGLGAARERWLAAWREYGLPARQVVSVVPSEWRARVLSPGWARAGRAAVRAQEQAVAGATVGELVRGDEAAAILIARWAMRAAKVARVLPPTPGTRTTRTPVTKETRNA